jgi:hypothetical protein
MSNPPPEGVITPAEVIESPQSMVAVNGPASLAVKCITLAVNATVSVAVIGTGVVLVTARRQRASSISRSYRRLNRPLRARKPGTQLFEIREPEILGNGSCFLCRRLAVSVIIVSASEVKVPCVGASNHERTARSTTRHDERDLCARLPSGHSRLFLEAEPP